MVHKELIIDTGFFLALFLKTDQFHEKELKLRKSSDNKKWTTPESF